MNETEARLEEVFRKALHLTGAGVKERTDALDFAMPGVRAVLAIQGPGGDPPTTEPFDVREHRTEIERAAALCPVPDAEELESLARIREQAKGLRHYEGRELQKYVATLAAKLRHAWNFRIAAEPLVRAALREGETKP
jgi:hypothetical protein